MLDQVEHKLRLLPPPVKRAAKRAVPAVDPILVRRYRRETGDQSPIPPAVLRSRVGAGIRIDAYVGEGQRVAMELNRALAAQGTGLVQRNVIFDWGCGCGRLLQHIEHYASDDAVLGGSDVDAEAIAWAARAWPHMKLFVSGFKPPLQLEDGSVDCLVSSSIFTHLTEADQDLWLEELHRVVAPDGYALITVAGEASFENTIAQGSTTRSKDLVDRLAALPPLEENGFLFEPYTRGRWEDADFPGIDDTYGVTFHHPAYVERHWSQWFELLEHRPASVNHLQDLLVLRPAR
jgi:SAM-dependent methyltransferase